MSETAAAQSPATAADLDALRAEFTGYVAELNEGLVMAMAGVCVSLATTGAVSSEVLIRHLRETTATLMTARKSDLVQSATDQLVFALQQLSGGGSRTDAGH